MGCAAVSLFVTATSLAFAADVSVGVLVSSTGPASIIGLPQRNSVKLLPEQVGGHRVRYVVLDDGGDATTAVNNAKKLIAEEHVDAILGPSISPNAMAVLHFVAASGTPMIAAVGTDGVIYPMDADRKWAFKSAQANNLILQVEIDHMVHNHVKSLGILRTNDALGEEWAKSLTPIIAAAHINLVADERFQRSDSSIVAQVLRIMAAKPDAVLVAAPGGNAALGQQSLVDKGYRGKIYQTNGAATDDFIRLAGKSAEGAIMAAGPIQVVLQLDDSNPAKRVAMDYMTAYEKAFGSKPSSFGSNLYDGGRILQSAIPVAAAKAAPGTAAFRAALRDAIEATNGVIGTQGVYNMTPENHNGMGPGSALIMTVKDKRWMLVK